MTARGVLAALIAVGAGLPFYPLWATLAIGAGAGLLVPFVQYAIDYLLRLDDPTSAIAMHGIPALWGLLAVGLFASGQGGGGWNQVGAVAYLDVEGQGVTGYLALPGYVSDWPGQFYAQVIGATAIGVTAFVLSWLLFALVQGITRAWQGEYIVRLPRRTGGRRQARVPGYAAAGRRWPRIRFVRTGQETPASGSEASTPEPDRHIEAPNEAPESTPQRIMAALVLSWRRVRDGVMTVASSVRRPEQAERSEVSSERDEDLAETRDAPVQAGDSPEAVDVSSQAGDASPEGDDASLEPGDDSLETRDPAIEGDEG
jgi:hypothetical protein